MQTDPRITVAICTYNRAGYLQDTLENLARQDAHAEEFEILVINNNSTDGTKTVCEIFDQSNPRLRFRSVLEKKQGLSHARNRAAKEAQASSIIYIDDDVILERDFVESALYYIEKRPSTLCAGGRIFVTFDGEESRPDWIPDELMPMFGLHDLGDDDREYPPLNFPRGGNMMIRSSVFDAFGYFDTTLGRTGDILLGSEEKAFFERLRKNGVKLHYWPNMRLTHRIGPNRLQKDYLKKQSVGIGRSERLRTIHSNSETIKKLSTEGIKCAGSLLLSVWYLIRGKTKAAGFILKFRIWVLFGFFKLPEIKKED